MALACFGLSTSFDTACNFEPCHHNHCLVIVDAFVFEYSAEDMSTSGLFMMSLLKRSMGASRISLEDALSRPVPLIVNDCDGVG